MKPLRLTIAGLNSFRDRQEIDFTRLTELGMFGIFGPTGSGKSSILDAITLALYGHVVRADRNTQGILNQAEKKLEVTLDFEIGTTGMRKRYRVERQYRRGGTGEYSIQNQASRLLLLEPGPDGDIGMAVVADSKRDVDRAILAIVGLEQSDFTRAVVLPQGKFAEFLQLTGTERNAMTERLFGLERLGQSLLRRVSDRGRAAENAKAVIEAQQTELGDASLAAVEALEAALEEARTQFAAADVARTAARRQMDEVLHIRDLIHRANQVRAEQDALAARAPGIASLRVSLERHAQAVVVWPHVTAWKAADAAAVAAHSSWRTAKEVAARAEAELAAATAQWNEARARRDAEEPRLRERIGGLVEAERLEQDFAVIQTQYKSEESTLQIAKTAVAESVAARDRATEHLRDCQQRLQDAEDLVSARTITPELRQRLAKLRTALDAWRTQGESLASAERQLRGREDVLAVADESVHGARAEEERLHNEIQKLMAERSLLEGAAPACTRDEVSGLQKWQAHVEMRLVGFTEAKQQATAARASVESAKHKLQESQQRADDLRRKAESAAQRLQETRDAQQRFLASHETALIVRLQTRLGDGLPCPVCGSTHYAMPAANAAPALLEDEVSTVDFDEQAQVAEAVWRAADVAAQAAERVAAQAETTVQLLAQEASRTVLQQSALEDELRQMWIPEIRALGVDVAAQSFVDWQNAWTTVSDRLTKALEDRDRWETKERNLATAEGEAVERHRQARQALEIASVAQRAAQSEVSTQSAQVTELAHAVATLEAKLLGALGACQPDDVAQIPDSSGLANLVQQRLQQAEDDDRLAADGQARVTQLRSEMHSLQQQLALTERQVAAAERAVSVAQTRAEHLKAELGALLSRLHEYTDGVPVSVVKTSVQQTLDRLQSEAKAAEETVQNTSAATQAAVKAEAAAATEARTQSEAQAQQERRLGEALSAAGFVNVPAVEDARLMDAEVASKTAEVEIYSEAVARTTALAADLETQLAGRTVDDVAVQTAEAELKAAEESYNTCAKAEGAAQENLVQLKAKRVRWQELDEERRQADALCTRLGAISRVLRGNAFVRFVAREQMERVARQASERLSNLTHGRYTLLIDEDGDFLMRDDHNGGATRPVSTLSGGETFLTSLALALALSTHIQLRGQHPLEFFFLDEGFGTLDPELLDVVVTSLERLNLERLCVGLISHVPELRQRLQRRLIVEPAMPAGRGTTVRLEFA